MRRLLSVVVGLGLLVSAGLAGVAAAPAAASEPDYAKIAPSLAEVLAAGGYGSFPMAQVVRDYQPGTVYYLARVSGHVDDTLVTALHGAGAAVRFRFPEIGYVALVSSLDAVGAVSRLPQVARLELDRVHDIESISTSLAVGRFGDQSRRGTHDVGADVLWNAGITGTGVRVGVTDSGIDSTHPDLGYKLKGFADCTQVLPSVLTGVQDVGVCRDGPGYDDNGHGSHVSGIAVGGAKGLLPTQAGLFPGMAPDADLVGAKVCLAAGSCLNSSVMAGLRYVATDTAEGGLGADVVNVSLGGGRFYFSPVNGAEQVTNNDAEAKLVNELAQRYNVVFTISAGNSGPVLQSTGSPAVASQVIAVGAAITDFDLNHPVEQTQHGELGNIRPEAAAAGATGLAQFSSRGPTGDRLIKPELTAPGVYYIAAEAAAGAEVKAADVAHGHNFSADPTYAVLSGTSMSAPAAAGAAALLWDGYRQATGQNPLYYRVKAALANTAGTRAFEGSVIGLLSGIRAKRLGEDPGALFPLRNQEWVGDTGEGAGRIYAPSALLALTKGVIAYTPQAGELDDVHELQPNWALDDVGAGESRVQTFLLHGAPGLARKTTATFAVQQEREPAGVLSAPASWFKLPKSVSVAPNRDQSFLLGLNVPAGAAPGMYEATVVGTAKLSSTTTQRIAIPVQFFVPVRDANPAAGAGTSVEGPIWASEATDYSAIGFENPEADVFTDWATFPVRLGTDAKRLDLSVYDPEGKDHMDLFVFDQNGQEVDSTVTPFLDHAVPGGALYAPTTKDSPNTVSLLDGDDLGTVTLPTTVWVEVSDSGPDQLGFSTFHLDADIDATGSGGGTTPAERIHSGTHALWSGSLSDADGYATESVAVPAAARSLRFWTWYNLEDGFDWAYVLVSTDGGATWTSLASTAAGAAGTTDQDPLGATGNVAGGNKRYPNGFTGSSGTPPFTSQGLVTPAYTEQTADLSAYAGRTVLLRFAYTSDASTNLEGFYVDDVSIVDAAGTPLLSDDLETAGAWTSGGAPGFTWVTASQSP